MRSGTSCFDGTIFKKTVFRFWPLWGFYCAVWLIALPLNGITMLQLDALNRGMADHSAGYMINFAYRTVPGLSDMCLFMAVVFGVLSAMAVLSHLYNARSANFFGALPVRREGLFLTHYLAGLAFLIVPNAVIFLLTLAVELAGGGVCLPGLLFWLAVSCGECLFFYSMAVFCGLFTGHLLALPAFYGIFNGLAAAVMGLLYITLNAFYYGYAGPGEWMETVMRWLTPVWALEDAVESWWAGYYAAVPDGHWALELHGLGVVGVYALVGLALAAGSFFLYRARRMESAGDVVSVRCMRPVFKYGVAICAGLSFGYFTMFFLSVRETGLMIAIVVWGIVGYFAAQMLLDKSFKVFHKWKGAAAVTGVFIILFLVVGFDLTGFETRIPNEADVASVEVEGLRWGWRDDSGDYIYLELDDPQSIRLMMDLHRAAVGQRDRTGESWGYSGSSTYCTLTYHLANGSTMSRYYTLYIDPSQTGQEGSAAWALEHILADRDLYWRVYGFDTLEQRLANGGRLENAGYSYYRYSEDERVENSWYYYGGDARALLDAVEEDFWAGRIGVRHVEEDDDPGYQRSVGFEVRYGDDRRQTVRIFVPDSATSTLAALDEMADRAVRSGDYADTDSPVDMPVQ